MGQDIITLHGHDAAPIWNMDETRITNAMQMTVWGTIMWSRHYWGRMVDPTYSTQTCTLTLLIVVGFEPTLVTNMVSLILKKLHLKEENGLIFEPFLAWSRWFLRTKTRVTSDSYAPEEQAKL